MLALMIAGISTAARLDLSATETANCYMVSGGEKYSFRADIKGNGVETLGLSGVPPISMACGPVLICSWN